MRWRAATIGRNADAPILARCVVPALDNVDRGHGVNMRPEWEANGGRLTQPGPWQRLHNRRPGHKTRGHGRHNVGAELATEPAIDCLVPHATFKFGQSVCDFHHVRPERRFNFGQYRDEFGQRCPKIDTWAVLAKCVAKDRLWLTVCIEEHLRCTKRLTEHAPKEGGGVGYEMRKKQSNGESPPRRPLDGRTGILQNDQTNTPPSILRVSCVCRPPNSARILSSLIKHCPI